MSKNYLQTFRNGERHYSFGGYSCVAKIMGNAADFKALAERKGKTVINISLNM